MTHIIFFLSVWKYAEKNRYQDSSQEERLLSLSYFKAKLKSSTNCNNQNVFTRCAKFHFNAYNFNKGVVIRINELEEG